VAWAEAYLHTKWHLDPSSRLATIDMVRKLGALHPFGGRGSSLFGRGELGPHLIQCGHGRGLSACQVSSWPIKPFGDSTPTFQTDRTDNGLIAWGEPFYKRSPKNGSRDPDHPHL